MRKQITLWVSLDEYEAITGLSYGGNRSAYIRSLIRADAAQRGVAWPEKVLQDTRGKYKRKAK